MPVICNHTVQDYLDAIEEVGPFYTEIAKYLGLAYVTVNTSVKKHPKLKEAFMAAREAWVDKAERNVVTAVEEGDLKMSQFILTTIGKERGYSTRQEITGENGGPVRHAIGPDLEAMSDAELRLYFERLTQTSNNLLCAPNDGRAG